MKYLRSLTAFILVTVFLVSGLVLPSHGAESGGSVWIAAPNDLVFNLGGLRSRFIVIEEWNTTTNYPPKTLLQHDSHLWVALADTAAGEEPGVHADWLSLSSCHPS